MLVSPTQNFGVGDLDQRKAPTQKFCVAVEYRLKIAANWPVSSHCVAGP